MDSKPLTATHTPVAQHTVHHFPTSGVTFSSQFDSGNLGKVDMLTPTSFALWTAPDCAGSLAESSSRSWFYYLVQTTESKTITFTVKNLNLQGKMYREGMKPVFKTRSTTWERIPETVTYAVAGEVATLFEITFTHEFTQLEAWFAFTYPWSYSDNEAFLDSLERSLNRDLFFHRSTLIYSLECRKCEVLAISSPDDLILLPGNHYQRPLFPLGNPLPVFQTEKSVVFLSARVHPGETPGSYMLNGFLKWIVSADPRAIAARRLFVFIVLPMLNPDGVYRGHYRLDTRGANLNRSYSSPEVQYAPTIWAARELMLSLNSSCQDGVYCYVDLHAHASKRGVFVYGNAMDFWKTVSAMSFAKLLSINCPHFDYDGSVFDEKNMKTKEARDETSKEGCGRVAFYTLTGLSMCFTLEANFNSGAGVNQLLSSEMTEDANEEMMVEMHRSGGFPYTVNIFEEVGKALGVSLLDSVEENANSRLKKTGFRNYTGLKMTVAETLAATSQYRNDQDLKKILKTKEKFLEALQAKSAPSVSKSQNCRAKVSSYRPPKPKHDSQPKSGVGELSRSSRNVITKPISCRGAKRLASETPFLYRKQAPKRVFGHAHRRADSSFRSSRSSSHDPSDLLLSIPCPAE